MSKRGKTTGLSLSVMLILALAVPLALLLMSATAPKTEAWISSDWPRRRPVTITAGGNGMPENYQIKIFIAYDSDMQPDFEDLRFTLTDDTLLPYWIEDYNLSENATVWVRLPFSLGANASQQIYMYYGNPSATSTSNGETVFLHFDDFESSEGYTDGSTIIGVDGWVVTSGSSSAMIATSSLAKNGAMSARHYSATQSRADATKTLENYSFDFFVQQYARCSMVTGAQDWVSWEFSHPDGSCIVRFYGGNIQYYDGGSCYNIQSQAANTWYKTRIDVKLTTDKFDVWINDVKKVTNANFSSGGATAIKLFHGAYINQSGTLYGYFDTVIVGKYVSPEPTVSVGAEQTLSNPPSSLWCEGGVNPQKVTDLTPEFSAVHTNLCGSSAEKYRIQVSTDGTFASVTHWDSGTAGMATTAHNSRCPDITYGGTSLTRGTTYYWRIKFWNVDEGEGAWSTESATFKLNRLPTTSCASPTRLTTLTPTLSWNYSDADGDEQAQRQVQVTTDPTYETITHWDSTVADNATSATYAGATLSRGATYYWRVRTKDIVEYNSAENVWGDWAVSTFKLNQLPTQTSSAPSGVVIVPTPPPTITWNFSDPDGDAQQGVKIQVSTDNSFTMITYWDYSDTTTTAQSISYAGTTLQRGVQYYIRVQVRDDLGEWSGTWATDNFVLKGAPYITDLNTSITLIDRKIDQPNSGAVDSVTIYLTARDNWGRDYLENAYFWIRDASGVERVVNAKHSGYENVDTSTKRFFITYDPDNSLPDGSLGQFSVKGRVVASDLQDNVQDYGGLGSSLFTVSDLNVTLGIADNTPTYQISTSGTVTRVFGTTTVDNVRILDNNQGDIAATFTDNSYSKNYGLVSPVRLHRGDQGQLYVWARDDTLDGVSPTVTYQVEGDNASVSLLGITNQVGQAVLDIRVKWTSDDSNANGTICIKYREQFQAPISGIGQLILSYDNWISSGPSILTLFDNADRPLWRAITDTFETDSIFFEKFYLTGDQDNARVKIRTYYTDGTVPALMTAHLNVAGTSWGQKVPDGDGYIEWVGVDLPDNQLNIELKFDNVLDERSDRVINCKRLEDVAIYTENTTVDLVIDENEPTIYYGSSGSFTGTLTSQASHIDLKLQENLYYENGSLADNTGVLIFTPGENKSWSFSRAPLRITDYTLKVFSTNGTFMWSRPVRLNVKLRQPASASPADFYGTTDNVITIEWAQVTGKDNYLLQYTLDENFDTYTETTITDNTFTTPALSENKWYWRVRAQGENLVSADWLARSFWVDRVAPSLDSFSGPSSTSSRDITLSLSASDELGEVYQVRFREGDTWGAWQSYAASKGFTLSSGDGTKTVYAQVRDRAGNLSNVRSLSVTLSMPPPPTQPPEQPGASEPPHETDPPTLVLLTLMPSRVTQSGLQVQVAVADASKIGEVVVLLDNEPIAYTYLNDIITVSIYGLEDGGHVLVFRVTDEYGNRAERAVSFTVKLPPKPVPVENVFENFPAWENVPAGENIVLLGRLMVENVPAWENVEFTFPAEIIGITLVPSENLQKIILTARKHITLVGPAFDNTQKPYRYFDILLEVEGRDNYSGIVASLRFEFRVERAWIEGENIIDVKLYRLVDNSWQPVSTRFTREDFDYKYYEAVVPGLSLFSIVGIKAVAAQTILLPPITPGIPPLTLIAGLGAIGAGVAGGSWYYLHRRMPKEFVSRRELREGPWILELKHSLGVLVEKRVRELEREMEIERKNRRDRKGEGRVG